MARLQMSFLLLTLVLTFDLSLANCDDNCKTKKDHDNRQLPLEQPKKDANFTVHGLIPAVFTAFHEDYSINYDVIPDYAKYMARSGFTGIMVGGTAGQHMSLTLEDRKRLISMWAKAARAEGLQIVVQVGGAPYPDVMELARISDEAGVDGILTLPELYFRPKTTDELVSYVEDVSHAAPNTPILYYHNPNMTNVKLNMTAFLEAASAHIPNFKGIKSSSTDQVEGSQLLRNLRQDQEFFLGGYNLLAQPGVRSSMSAAHALFPRVSRDLLQAVENNEVEKSAALQNLLITAVKAHLAEGPYNPTVRAGMEIVSGLKMGPPARPLRPISAEAKNRIYTRLNTLDLVE